jgi:hypothetical protein
MRIISLIAAWVVLICMIPGSTPAQPPEASLRDKPRYSAVDTTGPRIHMPKPDSSLFDKEVRETVLMPELNKPRNPIFKDCAYCQKDRLEWYYDYDEFTKALALCGADYIRLRFDRSYTGDRFYNKVSYFFSLKNDILLFDSLSIDLEADAVKSKTTITDNMFLNTAEEIGGSLAADMSDFLRDLTNGIGGEAQSEAWQRRIEQVRLFKAAAVAKKVHDSFVSKMKLTQGNKGVRCILQFAVLDRRFTLESEVGDTIQTISLNQSKDKDAFTLEAAQRGAYGIGYYLDAPVSKNKERNEAPPPVIVDYWVSKVKREGYAVLHIEVKSAAGLSKLIMPVNNSWRTINLSGEKEYVHAEYIGVIPNSCIMLYSYAEDINGKVVGSKPHWVVDESGAMPVRERFDKYWRDCPNCK